MLDAIGFIYLVSPGGVEYPWCVSCLPTDDTIDTLREHAKKWKPGWKFIGAEILHYNQSVEADAETDPRRSL